MEPCSSNTLVRWTIAHQLRTAAEQELSKASASDVIVEADIMRDALDALAALSDLLGNSEWFLDQTQPGLFDASVFAYTHLILDGSMQWQSNNLAEILHKHENLLRHRERISEMYY